MFEGLIKSRDMNHILFFVKQVGNQLLDPINLHLFTHEWKVAMEVMKVIRVRHIHLQEVALSLLLSQLTEAPLELFQSFHPFEPTGW